jgi:hypothetical protein
MQRHDIENTVQCLFYLVWPIICGNAMARGQEVNVRAHCPNAGKKVCGNLDNRKGTLKVKHSLEFLPMGVRRRPTHGREFLWRPDVAKRMNTGTDTYTPNFFWDLGIIFGPFL